MKARHHFAGGTDEHHSLAGLVDRVANGDSPAFELLYDEVADDVFQTVLRVLVDPAHSEEVTQEVLFEIWRKAAQFDPARGSVEAWIRTMARRRAIDRVRSVTSRRDADARRRAGPASTAHDEVFDQVHRRRSQDEVQTPLRRLSPFQREAVSLAFLSELTHSQVADILGIPLGTAKTRIRDGLISLRQLVSVAPDSV